MTTISENSELGQNPDAETTVVLLRGFINVCRNNRLDFAEDVEELCATAARIVGEDTVVRPNFVFNRQTGYMDLGL